MRKEYEVKDLSVTLEQIKKDFPDVIIETLEEIALANIFTDNNPLPNAYKVISVANEIYIPFNKNEILIPVTLPNRKSKVYTTITRVLISMMKDLDFNDYAGIGFKKIKDINRIKKLIYKPTMDMPDWIIRNHYLTAVGIGPIIYNL
ncbi:TPA: hypothetical protein HA235_04410 [Candidatus Woesearchaeota archaeon]|nr:hypothetical protein [Candidatus Woesearchaeota archaeon]HIH31925.1 hypothetical protein [Candidatus Woesearchaeota archaeon]HIH55505.1 hypothetical protein [Candidatus Woesearchaeota archaeon]HIJ01062.1 hypothetical protein [Candidatus Woesearchaeota archaeon]HIJ14713.1 hypothetical protein [Candidatus Woesearchaeota archaeon]